MRQARIDTGTAKGETDPGLDYKAGIRAGDSP